MRALPALLACGMLMAAGQAAASCTPLRVAYINQNVPPYYLGDGPAPPDPPGAAIEMIQKIAASAGCTVTFTRLPLARIRVALAAGSIDAAPLNALPDDEHIAVFPLANGVRDTEKAIAATTIVLVRASDKLAIDTDPARYFLSHKLGVSHGASYVIPLRAAGLTIDDGATNLERNLEKLRLGRIDGCTLTVTELEEFDTHLRARIGSDIVRLDKPLRVAHTWLAFSRAYYDANGPQVETMWSWLKANRRSEFREIFKKY
ncbi:MAG: hypothetical protein V4463_11290 [Pseudomonadota bacterium]